MDYCCFKPSTEVFSTFFRGLKENCQIQHTLVYHTQKKSQGFFVFDILNLCENNVKQIQFPVKICAGDI